jgi:hypothetical protein
VPDDPDIWSEWQCRLVAQQCIANYNGYATPNECWDYRASAHCPDTPPPDDPDPWVPCIYPCIPEPSPF